MKNFKHYLQLWDGIWSIPLSTIVFFAIGELGQYYFGAGFSFYEPSVFQAAILAAAMLILFNAIIWLGIYMNFRGLYRFYVTDSKLIFLKLTPWQKLRILFFVYFSFLLALLLLTTRLV